MTKLDLVLRAFLIFGGIYLIFDGLLHLIDFRLADPKYLWASGPYAYSAFIGHLYGSFTVFAALMCFGVSRNIKKYRSLIQIAALWALLHSLLIVYSSITINFVGLFAGLPSVYVWMPFYNLYLFFEALLMLSFSLLVLVWSKKNESN